MNEQMDYTLAPCLEHRALVRIAVALWNEVIESDLMSRFDILSPTINYYKWNGQKAWYKVEDEVTKKVTKLPIPKLLKDKLSRFTASAGRQMLIWKTYHNDLIGVLNANNNLSKLFWTPHGTVDKQKTAKIIVKDESIGIYERYKLACTYCLEDYIFVLWEQLEDFLKRDLLQRIMYTWPLVSFWSHYIAGDRDRLGDVMRRHGEINASDYVYAFFFSGDRGNEAAVRYFFKKLAPEEKDRLLFKTTKYILEKPPNCASERGIFPTEYYSDVLCFLLSQMDKDLQTEVFKGYSNEVLKRLLLWPWQDFFIETAQRSWTFLSENMYYHLLWDIVYHRIMEDYRDCNYTILFGQFWQQGPNSHKKYVIERCTTDSYLLSGLFKIGNVENIKLIFKNATLEERENLILGGRGQDICLHLIYCEKWELLEFFIGECVSSYDALMRFEKECKTTVMLPCFEERVAKNVDKFHHFFQLIENLKRGYSKRTSVGKGCSPHKKLRKRHVIDQ